MADTAPDAGGEASDGPPGDAETRAAASGCGCRAAGTGASWFPLLLAAVVAALRPRRRRT